MIRGLFLLILLSFSLARVVMFHKAAIGGDNSFFNVDNWNDTLPVDGDDVIIQIEGTGCTGTDTARCIVDGDTPLLSSFVVKTNLFTAITCPSTVSVHNGKKIRATHVELQDGSKMGLNGGRIEASTVVLKPQTFLTGTGIIVATTSVDVQGLAFVIPGWFGNTACHRCWPVDWNRDTSMYGDLKFETPTATCASSSRFIFKDLLLNSEFPNRLRPGTVHDTVEFTGHITVTGVDILVVHSNNSMAPTLPVSQILTPIVGSFNWPSNAPLLSWNSITLTSAFIISHDTIQRPITRCQSGYQLHFPTPPNAVYTCPNILTTACLSCDYSSSCPTVQSTTLSITIGVSPASCPAQAQPVAVVPAPATTAATSTDADATEDRSSSVPIAAIVVPIVAVVGIAVAVLIYVAHRRKVKSDTAQFAHLQRQASLTDLKDASASQVTPSGY